jgi:tRNA dimethylallyltransferase
LSARLILIAGPTASGKSALALWAAERASGEIVNADALQLYRDLRVLSARPSPEEEARVPHHLFGAADAADGWSVGRWLRAATDVLEDIAARGRPAVVVGGTGLYFKALTEGLAEIPPTAPEAVGAAEHMFDIEGEIATRAALLAVDPAAASRIGPGDRQRLVRALAVARATGRALSDWQADTRPLLAPGAWFGVVLAPPREALYARCDARLAAMVEQGAIEEAAALTARGLDPTLPAMKAVGLRELAACAQGVIGLDEALAAARIATRQYAKRQMTWLRNQTPDWPRIDALEADDQRRQFLTLTARLTPPPSHGI